MSSICAERRRVVHYACSREDTFEYRHSTLVFADTITEDVPPSAYTNHRYTLYPPMREVSYGLY